MAVSVLKLTQLGSDFPDHFRDTRTLILDAGLLIHDAVDRITLHGSRGPKGGARASSDLDLCFVVNASSLAAASDREELLREVILTALSGWNGTVKLDVAAVFDRSGCQLRCLNVTELNPNLCINTVDCMGIFKIPEGYISGPSVDCSLMYPLVEIWSRPKIAG
jgi:hypothetical protein